MRPHAPLLRTVRCPPRGPSPPWGGPAAAVPSPHAPLLRTVRCPPRGPSPPWGGPAAARSRPHAPLQQHKRSGFTLVEVLVALSIMAVIAVMTWRALDGMARTQQTTDAYTDGVLRLQAALGQWRADLDAMMVWPATTPPSPNAPVSLLWDGRVLRITRGVSGNAAAGVEVVAWTRRGSDGAWMRWQSAPVQTIAGWRAAWGAAASWAGAGAGDASAQAVTVAHALDWQLQYFRNNAWTNPLSSAAESSTQTDVLPDAIRLLITLAPGQAINGLLTIDWIRPTFGGTR